MKVTVRKGGTYKEHFVPSHAGHKEDLRHLPLSQKERETLATDTAMELPYDKVLDNVWTSLQDSELQRIHLSTKNNVDVLSIFLQYVKSQVGPIYTNVFMSDLAESYSNAWNRTMGAPKIRLYCTWHVDRAWKTNIKRKIADLDKRNQAYRVIKSVSMLRNVSMFQESLQKALQKLRSDPDTSEFASYFKTHYEGNVECWAYCHRMYAGLNTNTNVESMHRTLKEIHGNAWQIKPLDKGISTLMSLVTAKMFDWLIANVKGKITSKVQDICNNHKTSLLMDKDLITEVDGGSEAPSTSSSEVYIVKDNTDICEHESKCSDCNVCIHTYYCTCMDYYIRFNICKHVHPVFHDSVCENPLQSPEVLGTDDDVEATSEREAILAEANVGAVRAQNDYFRQTDKGHKRKLMPQRRLFPTKKKTACNISLAVPNAEESCEIVKSLLNEGLDIVAVQHDYAIPNVQQSTTVQITPPQQQNGRRSQFAICATRGKRNSIP
ncbi:uncharacterized protein LOC126470691 [Schistocerca serialis cubense]|uniref:uncharacterized protein LOC126470691 n=1 Tax=Schistocerca serialis cubense TaxID=2023355 RepID=UPI00214E11A6|nr:uncharacterized protein LOC126470691 [Schistocerca serialis cubense]